MPRRAVQSTAYKRYVLLAMMSVYGLQLCDRGVIALALQSIKEDLHLSDTQLGLVTGIAFALFYATLGVPIARWADRGNRVTIIALAIGLWSLTVMAYLFVANYMQLIIARVFSGMGDAGCTPPTYSLLGDYFAGPAERTRAMYILDITGALSGIVTFSTAGWLIDHYGWRLTFFVLGIPGLILAVLFKLTVVEPRTTVRQAPDWPPAPAIPPMKAVLALMWHQRTCRHLVIAMTVYYTMAFGLNPFFLSFMMRSHDMGATQLGIWMGMVSGPSTLIALLLGAYVIGRWFAGNERGQLRVSALATISSVPCFILFLLAPDGRVAFMGYTLQAMLICAFTSPIYAILQRLVPDTMRATVFATLMMLVNLIGMGLGPLLVGALSDLLTPAFGLDGLRYAMLAVSLIAIWTGYHYWKAAERVAEDIAAMHASSSSTHTATAQSYA